MKTQSQQSILGYNWQEKSYNERLALTIQQKFELNNVLARLLASRDLSLDEVENFLEPTIKSSLPNPFDLLDMDVAVSYIIDVIKNKKKITIFADYDVDGATSSALLKRFFAEIGVEVDIYVPDRILEGYGPNVQALLDLKKKGTDLVITVDCGTIAFEPLEEAHKAGLEIIVIDHHIGVIEKPKALAVINPNRIDENFPHKNICAAAVSFLFAVAINSKLREIGFYANNSNPPLEGGSKSLATSGRGIERLYSTKTLENAKELRQSQTLPENLLWRYLQNKQLNGHKFRRQQPIGNYIVDFVCFEKRLIIELDGSQHNEEDIIKYDKKRSEFFVENGYKVLRFWNNEIFDKIFGVLESILLEVESCYPSPKSRATSTLPQGEGIKSQEPNLLNLLDLVALGTVCDVMPLTGLNRAFVAQGLKIMRQRKNLGIRALCDIANLYEEPNAHHLGFVIGPRINAGGRVGTSNLGAKILSSDDENEVVEISSRLDKLNSDRKDLEKRVLEESVENLEKNKNGFSPKDDIIFAVSDGWHQGVIGIVASRLKDLYGKPVAVIALDGAKGKASCRSIQGIDFGGAILQAKMQELLIEGGGHAMAGGFSVYSEKVNALHKFFHEILSQKIQKILQENMREFDCEIDLQNINLELIKSLQSLEPYGTANRRPKFFIKNLRKMNAKLIGSDQNHISCNFSNLSNVGFAGNISAVAFRSVNTKLAEILLDQNFKKPINLIGDININNYMGAQKLQVIIEDIII